MSDKKISVVLLGKEESLKKALITNIFRRDLSEITKTRILKKTDKYENDTYKIFCTPDLHTGSEDIRNLFAINRNPDMSLLLVEDRIKAASVHHHFKELYKTTKKPTEEFRVLLPLSHNQSDRLLFNSLTTEQVLKELRDLAEERRRVSTTKRSASHTESDTPMEETGAMSNNWHSSETKRGSKKTHTYTPVNLILLGMCGAGKSASGNTILRGNPFPSKASSLPVTREFQEAETEIGGIRIRVIDTPDMFDDDINPADRVKHVQKCIELCQSGPCVFVLVMHISRFTDGERNIMKKMEKAFGPRVHKQTVILFTRGDDLKRGGMSLEHFLSSCQPDLMKIVAQCEYRCVVFENRSSDSQQVRRLMHEMEKVLEKQPERGLHRSQSLRCTPTYLSR